MKRFFAMLLFLSITFLGGCTQTATKISENSYRTKTAIMEAIASM